MTNAPHIGAGGVKFSAWCERVGIARNTAYRWREKGWIKPTMEIGGQLYLSAEEEARFWERAAAGEFAKDQTGMEATR